MSIIYAVIPCYNEEEVLPRSSRILEQKWRTLINNGCISPESRIAFVDDGSKDNTVAEVKKLRESDERVHLLSFSRNFGKEAAMYAGMEKSKGDYVVIMDVDLQDPPALLPQMLAHIEEGYDSVATRRVTRKGEPPIRSFFARMFYRMMKRISKTEMMDGARDYRLMSRQMVDGILAKKNLGTNRKMAPITVPLFSLHQRFTTQPTIVVVVQEKPIPKRVPAM